MSTFLAASMLGLGFWRFIAPEYAYALYGLPLPLEPDASPSPFIYAAGGRELALGLTYILLGMQRNRAGLKALIMGTVVGNSTFSKECADSCLFF